MNWKHVDEDFRQSWVTDGFEVWLSPNGYELYRTDQAITFLGVWDTLIEAQAAAETAGSIYVRAAEAFERVEKALAEAEDAIRDARKTTATLEAMIKAQALHKED